MKRILLLSAVALTLFACAKEDKVTGRTATVKADSPVFYATTEGAATPETKVYADDNLLVLWNEDDRISIFNRTTFNYEYIFTGEDGDNAGGYEEVPVSGFMTANDIDHIFAIYPYSKSNRVDNLGQKLTVYLPATQEYKEHSFGIGANTMVAITDDYFLAFKNVCGYLKFRFYGDDVTVTKVTLEGNNGEQIAGKAFVTPVKGGSPTSVMDSTATKKVTINCPDPVTLGPSSSECTEFIFVVPPTTFANGFKVRVTDVEGKVFEKSSTRSLTISRNRLESMGAMKVVPTIDNAYVEFEDDNFKAYCVENFDTNGDGEISYAEAQEVTRMHFYPDERHLNISSLKGIEAFTNLTYLFCGGWNSSNLGKITSLDVSKNTKLDTLDCGCNQLTSLDVSVNTNIKDLRCCWNNLTSLVVGNNSLLEYLDCDRNQLTSLDINGCSGLNVLRCCYNQLTSLNLTNNTALTQLFCYVNQLTSLDVTNNTALTELRCNENLLTSLNLTNNTALVTLSCRDNQLTSLDVTNNTSLARLWCYNNQLTSLVVTNNTALSVLSCFNNYLTSLDVANNSSLTGLYCYNNQLTSLNVTNNTALTSLDCHSNLLTHLDASNLSLTSLNVSDNAGLQSLDCHSNQLNSLNINDNPALTTLNCHSNNITSLEVSGNPDLTDLTAWPQNVTLATLYISAVQNLQYKNSSGDVINPTDYSTEIIVRPTLQYEDYKNISYDIFWFVDTDAMAWTNRPGSIDENLDATTAKLQKARNTDNYYKLVLYSGAASIEFKNNGDSTITIDKYPGYNDPITINSGYVCFTSTVNGHTYYFELRPAKCSVYPSTSPLINSGDYIELEGWIKKDDSWYPNTYNTYQSFLVK